MKTANCRVNFLAILPRVVGPCPVIIILNGVSSGNGILIWRFFFKIANSPN